ncbi:MAG: TIGR00289 family protein, partial [Candidatus Bathyarchaeia archaeon]
MRLGVLFSGGKDSALALHKAAESAEIVCLITLVSENKESFMFHTPNIAITALQAEALGLPLIRKVTKGEPEKELKD